jgi:hypothetical protein
MSSQPEEPINNSNEHENEGITTSLLEPPRKKREETFSFPFETEETSNLSNTTAKIGSAGTITGTPDGERKNCLQAGCILFKCYYSYYHRQ